MNDKIEVRDLVKFKGFEVPESVSLSIKIGSISQIISIEGPDQQNIPGKYLITSDHPLEVNILGSSKPIIVLATHEKYYEKITPAEKAVNREFVLSALGIRRFDPMANS